MTVSKAILRRFFITSNLVLSTLEYNLIRKSPWIYVRPLPQPQGMSYSMRAGIIMVTASNILNDNVVNIL